MSEIGALKLQGVQIKTYIVLQLVLGLNIEHYTNLNVYFHNRGQVLLPSWNDAFGSALFNAYTYRNKENNETDRNQHYATIELC